MSIDGRRSTVYGINFRKKLKNRSKIRKPMTRSVQQPRSRITCVYVRNAVRRPYEVSFVREMSPLIRSKVQENRHCLPLSGIVNNDR